MRFPPIKRGGENRTLREDGKGLTTGGGRLNPGTGLDRGSVHGSQLGATRGRPHGDGGA